MYVDMYGNNVCLTVDKRYCAGIQLNLTISLYVKQNTIKLTHVCFFFIMYFVFPLFFKVCFLTCFDVFINLLIDTK